jgi:LysM repeat protein
MTGGWTPDSDNYVQTILEKNNMSKKQGQPPCDHKVEDGDTFSNLALAYYGDGSDAMSKKIADANPGVSPTNLKIGQKLKIPA